MATLKERRKTDRDRMERWRKSQAEKGKKTISTVISQEAQQILVKIKEETGDSISASVDKAIRMYGATLKSKI